MIIEADSRYQQFQRKTLRVHCRTDVDYQLVLDALSAPGTAIKDSPKNTTRRVNDWLIKATPCRPLNIVKLSLLHSRGWRAWNAALYLERHAVPIAPPVAFIERNCWGIVPWNAMVSEFLVETVNVEKWIEARVRHNARNDETARFFSQLAETVNVLCAAGVCHEDLSGKNILTRDGSQFWFVDLEAIRLQPCTQGQRLKNHIQLYDSFCNFVDDDSLLPFLSQMLPDASQINHWGPLVKEGQRHRRARQTEIWRKQGRK